MNNTKLKKAIDKEIGEKPLFTDKDKERFYNQKKMAGRSSWTHYFWPKLVTALLFLGVMSGGFYFVAEESPFESVTKPITDAPESESKEDLGSYEDPDLEKTPEEEPDSTPDTADEQEDENGQESDEQEQPNRDDNQQNESERETDNESDAESESEPELGSDSEQPDGNDSTNDPSSNDNNQNEGTSQDNNSNNNDNGQDSESEEPERVPFEQVQAKADDIQSQFQYGMTISQAKQAFGSGNYSRRNVVDLGERMVGEYYHFATDDLSFNEEGDISLDQFKQGHIGLSFTLTFDSNDRVRSGSYTYLAEDGETRRAVNFKSDGFVYVDGQAQSQKKYQIGFSGAMVEAIAQSAGKEPQNVTRQDLNQVGQLAVSHSGSGMLSVKATKADYYNEMTGLSAITLERTVIPAEHLARIPNLERLTIRDARADLNSFSNLDTLRYLDIRTPYVQPENVSALLELDNLETVVLDKQELSGEWQQLEENGIDVLESPPE
ncbi:hypothetical protein [Thalassobacillus sp. CUG 92003]|uniref:hypothetical protein n=1 Tax=Thalassobacillus sp. CUG 92003 TaxID=2736641 RepID=UPI0015E7260C|nr:hypothetical protein [Thalassobacillus sp. CUG 92003]